MSEEIGDFVTSINKYRRLISSTNSRSVAYLSRLSVQNHIYNIIICIKPWQTTMPSHTKYPPQFRSWWKPIDLWQIAERSLFRIHH